MRTETDAILSLQRHVNRALPDLVEVLTEAENEVLERPFATVSADGDRLVSGKRDMPIRTLPVTVYVYVEGRTRKDARRAVEDAREALDRAFVEGLNDDPAGLLPLYDYSGAPSVQRVTVGGSGTWRLGVDGHLSDPLPVGADLGEVAAAAQRAARASDPDLKLADGVVVWGRPLAGVYDVVFDGDFRGRPIPTMTAPVTGGATATVAAIADGDPEPWRGPRDYAGVEAFTLGARPDPTDPTLRTVTASLRLTWGRTANRPPLDTMQGVELAASTAST